MSLDLPDQSWKAVATHQSYMGFSRIPPTDMLHHGAENGVGGVDEGEGDGSVSVDQENDGAGEWNKSVDPENDGGEDADMQDIVQDDPNMSPDSHSHGTYHKWIHWQVTHWAALEMISTEFSTMAMPLRVSFIAVKHPSIQNTLQVKPWKDTMKELLALQPSTSAPALKTEAVIATISRWIMQQKGTKKWHNSIFYAFNNYPEHATFKSTMHLGEWAIALHGKDTRPFRKIINIDINHHVTLLSITLK